MVPRLQDANLKGTAELEIEILQAMGWPDFKEKQTNKDLVLITWWNAIRYHTIRYDMIRYDSIRKDTIQ